MNQPVYIVAAKRLAMGKAHKGSFSNERPDQMLAYLLKELVIEAKVDPQDIADVVIGCAFPEAEQGMNVARIAILLAGLPDTIAGITINRFCSSGLNSIAIAANQIANGEAEMVIAGGVESMSMVPMGGNDCSVSPQVFNQDVAIAFGMGITAENVATEFKITREAQDKFAVASHKKAAQAINNEYFKNEIISYPLKHKLINESNHQITVKVKHIDSDEGVRADTTLEALAKLKPVFSTLGSVTAGNSSQMSDGAAALILVSEKYLKTHNLTPIAKFLGFAAAGVPARIMGIGPIKAVPKVLAQVGLELAQIDWIELNEAFAAQSIAVINHLNLNPEIVNPCGGAIAVGHPLGATGSILATKLIHGLKRTNKKYGMVTMCIGSGMGAAGVFENIDHA